MIDCSAMTESEIKKLYKKTIKQYQKALKRVAYLHNHLNYCQNEMNKHRKTVKTIDSEADKPIHCLTDIT